MSRSRTYKRVVSHISKNIHHVTYLGPRWHTYLSPNRLHMSRSRTYKRVMSHVSKSIHHVTRTWDPKGTHTWVPIGSTCPGVAHISETCHAYKCVTSHVSRTSEQSQGVLQKGTHIWMSRVKHTWDPNSTHTWVPIGWFWLRSWLIHNRATWRVLQKGTHIWMSHVTHMNESWHTYEWVMSHIWMSRYTHMNESCHTYEWVMTHIWMSHVTHVNESWHTYKGIRSQV